MKNLYHFTLILMAFYISPNCQSLEHLYFPQPNNCSTIYGVMEIPDMNNAICVFGAKNTCTDSVAFWQIVDEQRNVLLEGQSPNHNLYTSGFYRKGKLYFYGFHKILRNPNSECLGALEVFENENLLFSTGDTTCIYVNTRKGITWHNGHIMLMSNDGVYTLKGQKLERYQDDRFNFIMATEKIDSMYYLLVPPRIVKTNFKNVHAGYHITIGNLPIEIIAETDRTFYMRNIEGQLFYIDIDSSQVITLLGKYAEDNDFNSFGFLGRYTDSKGKHHPYILYEVDDNVTRTCFFRKGICYKFEDLELDYVNFSHRLITDHNDIWYGHHVYQKPVKQGVLIHKYPNSVRPPSKDILSLIDIDSSYVVQDIHNGQLVDYHEIKYSITVGMNNSDSVSTCNIYLHENPGYPQHRLLAVEKNEETIHVRNPAVFNGVVRNDEPNKAFEFICATVDAPEGYQDIYYVNNTRCVTPKNPFVTSSTNQIDDSVILSPNPTSSHFEIYGLSENDNVSIFDASMKEVKRLDHITLKMTVDVSNFSPGVYFVRYTYNQNVYLKKLLIQR